MAVVFGGVNSYLAGKRLKFGLMTAIFAIAGLGTACLILAVASQVRSWRGMTGLVAIFLLAIICFGFVDVFKKRFNQVNGGMSGEADIKRMLSKLPNGYAVFRGLKIGERQDIDCVVVGPAGIFAVEIKSHKGRIGFDGLKLTRNGQPFEKDFIGETGREALGLKKMVNSAAGLEIYVKAVLVFSKASVPSGAQDIGNVLVVSKDRLPEIVASSARAVVSPDIVIRIAKGLGSYIDDSKKETKLIKLRKFYDREDR